VMGDPSPPNPLSRRSRERGLAADRAHPNPSNTLTPTATTPRGHPVPSPVRWERGTIGVRAHWSRSMRVSEQA
jgi:hypothetical protein